MISISASRALFQNYFVKRVSTLVSRLQSEDVTASSGRDDVDMPNLQENPFLKENPKCFLCHHNIEPDYKNVRLLSQFQSQYTGIVYPAAITGLCHYKQKRVEEEILKAQQAGLMGFVTKDPRYVNDPKLFNSNVRIKKGVL